MTTTNCDSLYLRPFLYEVSPAMREEFRRVYGPDGEWARLFSASSGYCGTVLHEFEHATGCYLVIDVFASKGDWLAFYEQHRIDYARMCETSKRLYVSESILSASEPLA